MAVEMAVAVKTAPIMEAETEVAPVGRKAAAVAMLFVVVATVALAVMAAVELIVVVVEQTGTMGSKMVVVRARIQATGGWKPV
jgi:hypothetical protein